MDNIIIFVLVIALLLILTKSHETFQQNKYDNYQIPEKDLKQQRYLSFLDDTYKQLKQTTKNLKSCVTKELNDEMKKEILQPVYKKWDEMTPEKMGFKKEVDKKTNVAIDCVGLSDYLCQFTDSNFYLSSDRVFLPPPWTLKSYKDIDYSKQTNLKCFNENLNCCKLLFKKK